MSMEILYFIALGKESRVRGCLNGGVHVDAGNHRNERPLFFAAKHGNESILKMLLKTGADPNLQNDAGLTALMAASDHGHNECVKDLLRWGALWRLKELKGLTPLSRITRLRNIAFKDTTPIQTSDIKADPSKSARSVDVFHIFSMKDCIVYNTKYLAKIQLRPSYNNNRVSKKEDDDFLEKEYRMLRSLVHPHIIMSHFISISSERKFNILITEPMSYGNLYHVLYDKKKSLQTKLVKMATDGILKALVYLTTKSIIHNFINSSSVYFTRGWVAKLGNFEYALLDGENPKRAMSSAAEKYHFPYMAPELHLYDDSLPSSASDVYSFGCLVWEMYGLRRPWSWLERTEIVCLAQVKHPITLPMSTCWPESIKTIIKIATKQRPFQRPTFRTLYSDVFRPLIESENGAILKSCNADDSSQIEFEKLEGSYISESGRRRHGVIDPTSRSVAMLQRANPSGIKTHCQSHCLCASHQANVPAIRVLDSATFSSEHVVNIVNVDSVEETTTFQEAAFQRKSTIKPKRNQSAARKEIFSVDPKPIAQRTSIKPPARDQLFTPESHISSKSKEMIALEPDLNSKRKSINTNRQDEPIKSSTRKSIRPVVHDETFELDARQIRKSIMPALNEEIFEPEARQTPQRRSLRPLAHEETFEQDAARQTPTRKSIRPPTHDESFEPEVRQTSHRRSIRPPTHEETFEPDTDRLTPNRNSIRPSTHDETFEPEARQTSQRRSIRPHTHEETFEPDTARQTPTRNSIRPPVHDESFEPEARQTSHRRSIRPPTHVETFEPDTDRLTPNRKSIRPSTHDESFEPEARQTPQRRSIRPPAHDESFEPEARQTSHRRSIRPPTHDETLEPEARQTPQRRSIRPLAHEEAFETDAARQTPNRKPTRPPTHDETFEPEVRQTPQRRSIRPPAHEETSESNAKQEPHRKSIRPPTHEETFEQEAIQTPHRKSARPPAQEETFEPERIIMDKRRSIRPSAHEETLDEPKHRQRQASIKPQVHEETYAPNPYHKQHRNSIKPPTHDGNINPEPRIVEQRATTVAEYDPPRQPQESIYSQHEFESNKKQYDHNEKHFSPKLDNRHQMNHHHYPEEPIDSRQQYNENYPMNNTRVYTENSKQVKSSETSRQDYREPNDNYTVNNPHKNYDINTTHTQRNTHPDKHQRSEMIQENLHRQAQNDTKHVNNEAHPMNNLSTRGYSEKTNQKQSVKRSGQTPEVIYNEITEENVQSGQKHQPKSAYKLPPRQLDIVQYIENLHKSDLSTKANKESLYQTREDIYQKREDPYQKRDSVNQDKQITGLSKNIHKDSNTEEKTNVKNNINQKQLILNTKPSDGQEQVTGTGGKSKDNKNNSTKPKQNNKNNKDSKKSKFPFKAFSRRRKSESSESDEVYDEPYEIVDGQRPITIYNNFTIQNQPDIVEKVQTTGFLNTPTSKEIRKISSPVSKENQELFSFTTKETNVPTSLVSKEAPVPTTLVSKETHVPTTLVSRETHVHHIPTTTKEIHCTFSDSGINHYEEVNTDPSNFLRIKKQNNKTVQYPSPLAEWSPASSIDVFREDFVSKGSFVKDFLGKMKNDAPSSFEKIENKLGSFFEKEDSVYELVSNPVVMSDKMEKDAQVQEIFQMAGNHERKNWAKLETTNRGRRNTKRMYCGDHLMEFGNDNSLSIRGGRSLMRKR